MDIHQHGLFQAEIKKERAGNSAMPHKVNPIDFENAEGNLRYGQRYPGASFFKITGIKTAERSSDNFTVLRNIKRACSPYHTL